jgi:predicted  nucleic acid-binding Zn-ribbon protein
MSDTLLGLTRLQRVELELHGLRNSIESRRRALKAIERRIQKQDEQIQQKTLQIRSLQAAADAAELEIKTREAEILRLRDALNKAKTNKEYAAILTQINTDKADNAKHEETALQQLSQVEAARKELEALKESRTRDHDRLARESQGVEAFAASRQSDLSRLQQERDQVAAGLAPAAVQAFERVAERHEGEALAPVEQPDRRRQEFVCGGCHMSIPLDIFNAVQFGDDLKHCGSCGRILYVPQSSGTGSR